MYVFVLDTSLLVKMPKNQKRNLRSQTSRSQINMVIYYFAFNKYLTLNKLLQLLFILLFLMQETKKDVNLSSNNIKKNTVFKASKSDKNKKPPTVSHVFCSVCLKEEPKKLSLCCQICETKSNCIY